MWAALEAVELHNYVKFGLLLILVKKRTHFIFVGSLEQQLLEKNSMLLFLKVARISALANGNFCVWPEL
jgi:hypothetical protein